MPNFMKAVKLLLCFGLLAAISLISQAFATEMVDFDLNHNGLIEPGTEITVLMKSTIKSDYKEIDTNLDGQIDASEAQAFDHKLDDAIVKKLGEYTDLLKGAKGMSYDDVQYIVFGPPKPTPPQMDSNGGKWLLRRDYENIGVKDDAKDPKNVKGALLAYTRDYKNHNDIWQVRGTLMYLLRNENTNGKKRGVTAWSLIPGVSFDRLSNSNESFTDINSLTFRLGSEIEYMGGGFMESQYWRLNLAYATDFDLKSGVLAAEVQWEPIDNDLGIGVARHVFGDLFEFRWRPILHAEAGSVLNAGKKGWLLEDEGFFRSGPKLHVDLWPLFADRIHIGFDWQYLKGFSGKPDYISLFQSDLSYNLNKEGNYAISFVYRNGRLPITFDKVKDLTLGLSVRY